MFWNFTQPPRNDGRIEKESGDEQGVCADLTSAKSCIMSFQWLVGSGRTWHCRRRFYTRERIELAEPEALFNMKSLMFSFWWNDPVYISTLNVSEFTFILSFSKFSLIMHIECSAGQWRSVMTFAKIWANGGENHWVFHTAKQVKFERLTLILSFQPGFMLKYHFHEMPVPEDTTAGVSSWEFGLWYQAACVWVLALHGARHVTLGRLRTFSEFLLSYLWNRGDNNSVVSPSVAVKPEGANVHVRCLGQNLTRHK